MPWPTARLIRELSAEALAGRVRLIELDRKLEALLAQHPDAAPIGNLPGMGAVLTAELIVRLLLARPRRQPRVLRPQAARRQTPPRRRPRLG
jgi:hypothetical protein